MDSLNLLLVGLDRQLSADIAARLHGHGEAVELTCEGLLDRPERATHHDVTIIALTTADGHACLDAVTLAARSHARRLCLLALVEAPEDRSLERAMTSAEIRGATLAMPLPAEASEILLATLEMSAKRQSLSPALGREAARLRAAIDS